MNLQSYIIISILFLTSFSCTKENISAIEEEDCMETQRAYVGGINSPSTGKVNEIIDIDVYFGVYNGCGGFSKFITTTTGNTKTIGLEVVYAGCLCYQNAPLLAETYEFKATESGIYYLNFISSPETVITATLTITK